MALQQTNVFDPMKRPAAAKRVKRFRTEQGCKGYVSRSKTIDVHSVKIEAVKYSPDRRDWWYRLSYSEVAI